MNGLSQRPRGRGERRSAIAKKARALVAVAVVATALTGVAAQSASAATAGFNYYLPGSGGSIYWFSDVWNHSTPGTIHINTSHIPACGGTTSVGLWSPQTGNQFTNSLVFTAHSNSANFVNAASGSTYIGSVGFSMDARRTGACTPSSSTDPVVALTGNLTY